MIENGDEPEVHHEDSPDKVMKGVEGESSDKDETTNAESATHNVTVTVPVSSEEPDSALDASPPNTRDAAIEFDGSTVTTLSPEAPLSPNPSHCLTSIDKNVLGSHSGSDAALGSDVQTASLSDGSISVTNRGIFPLYEFGQNPFGNDLVYHSGQQADMGVDLDPTFYTNTAMHSLPWWLDNPTLGSLSDPDINLSDPSLSYDASIQSQPTLQLPTWGQSLPNERGQDGEPSQTINIDSGSQLSHETPNAESAESDRLPVDAPLNAPASQPPDVTSCPAGALKVSKSGRSIIPSTRLEKMNEIGSNKENVTPATVSSKSSNEWADGAKKYMLGLELGDDWKACVNAWVMIEGSLGYGKGSNVR